MQLDVFQLGVRAQQPHARIRAPALAAARMQHAALQRGGVLSEVRAGLFQVFCSWACPRSNRTYEHLRWQPKGCNVERFSAEGLFRSYSPCLPPYSPLYASSSCFVFPSCSPSLPLLSPLYANNSCFMFPSCSPSLPPLSPLYASSICFVFPSCSPSLLPPPSPPPTPLSSPLGQYHSTLHPPYSPPIFLLETKDGA
ncbi:unnamed protein product [Closterium sp. Naga37s-1]|nr:unnamed protein product [Closterium sp. Naga37s-1]